MLTRKKNVLSVRLSMSFLLCNATTQFGALIPRYLPPRRLSSSSTSSSVRISAITHMTARFAKEKAGAGKKDEPAPTTGGGGNQWSLAASAILKDKPAPEWKDDSEYPPWLFAIDKPLPALSELIKMDYTKMSLRNQKRMLRIINRDKIRRSNAMKKKK